MCIYLRILSITESQTENSQKPVKKKKKKQNQILKAITKQTKKKKKICKIKDKNKGTSKQLQGGKSTLQLSKSLVSAESQMLRGMFIQSPDCLMKKNQNGSKLQLNTDLSLGRTTFFRKCCLNATISSIIANDNSQQHVRKRKPRQNGSRLSMFCNNIIDITLKEKYLSDTVSSSSCIVSIFSKL